MSQFLNRTNLNVFISRHPQSAWPSLDFLYPQGTCAAQQKTNERTVSVFCVLKCFLFVCCVRSISQAAQSKVECGRARGRRPFIGYENELVLQRLVIPQSSHCLYILVFMFSRIRPELMHKPYQTLPIELVTFRIYPNRNCPSILLRRTRVICSERVERVCLSLFCYQQLRLTRGQETLCSVNIIFKRLDDVRCVTRSTRC